MAYIELYAKNKEKSNKGNQSADQQRTKLLQEQGNTEGAGEKLKIRGREVWNLSFFVHRIIGTYLLVSFGYKFLR